MNKFYVFLLFSLQVSLSVQANASPLVYVPLDKPCRIVDTRGFASPFDVQAARTTQLFLAWGAAAALNLQRDLSGSQQLGDCQPQSGQIPQAMAANITVVARPYQAKGNVIVYPSGAGTPDSSTLNFVRNNIASSSIVSLSPDNSEHFEVTARLLGDEADNQRKADVIIDVSGFFYPQSVLVDEADYPELTYVPLPAPCRIVDTRGFASPFDRASKIWQSFRAWGSVSELDPQRDTDGSETLPACQPHPGATPAAMVANVTVAAKNFNSKGNIVAFPGGADEPDSSLLNFSANNIANTAIIGLNTENEAHFEILARIGLQDDQQHKVHVTVDVAGYFYPQAAFDPLSERPDLVYEPLTKPCRLVDTRGFASPFDDADKASQSFLGSGSVEQLNVQRDSAGDQQLGACQSPDGVPSVLVGTATAVAKGYHARGNLVAYPHGTTAPESSLVNFDNNNIANSLMTPLSVGDSGRFEVQARLFGHEAGNERKVDWVVDATGYFVPVEKNVVEIESAALLVCIQDQLGIAHDVTPSLEQLRGLQQLDCSSTGISNLNGISNLTGLTGLRLSDNQISDLTGLSNLTALTSLSLWRNQISDVSPLVNLPSLSFVHLDENPVTDCSSLGHVQELHGCTVIIPNSGLIQDSGLRACIKQTLGLNGSDRSAWDSMVINYRTGAEGEVEMFDRDYFLSSSATPALTEGHLLSLETLSCRSWGISNLDGLSGLKNLTHLDLSNDPSRSPGLNSISDFTPLAGLTNLTALVLDSSVAGGNISTLPNLVSLADLSLLGNQISNLTALTGLPNLTQLNLLFNDIVDISPLSGLNSLINLELAENEVSDVTALSNLNLLETLSLGWNPVLDCSPVNHVPSVSDCGFNRPIEDQNLKACILKNLGLADGVLPGTAIEESSFGFAAAQSYAISRTHIIPLAQVQLLSLETLSCISWDISSLEGIDSLTNLTNLDLSSDEEFDGIPFQNIGRNEISDLSPLIGLTNLTELDLQNSSISDVTGLSNLPALTSLNLRDNQISDVTGLSNLVALENLYLISNNISDVSPLASLSSLSQLWLDGNPVADCSPVAHVPNLSGC